MNQLRLLSDPGSRQRGRWVVGVESTQAGHLDHRPKKGPVVRGQHLQVRQGLGVERVQLGAGGLRGPVRAVPRVGTLWGPGVGRGRVTDPDAGQNVRALARR